MRLTLSLSDPVAKGLQATATQLADGNASMVADVALGHFLSLPADKVSALITRRRLDRKAGTRRGWTEAFWQVLGHEMGINDQMDNPYAMRNYGDFYAVLLLKDVGHYDDDPDPFVFHVAPQMWTQENAHKQRRFTFERSHSPVSAAEQIATWLRDLRANAQTNAVAG